MIWIFAARNIIDKDIQKSNFQLEIATYSPLNPSSVIPLALWIVE